MIKIEEPTCMKCGKLREYPTGQTIIGKIEICNCKNFVLDKVSEQGDKQ